MATPWLAVVALLVVVVLGGCAAGEDSNQVTVAGSTTVLPIAEIAAEHFHDQTGVDVLVSGLGSSAGIEAVSSGTADIATSSRDLTDEERASGLLVPTVVAHDGIAVIVNDANPVTELTMDQLRAVYAGQVTNWSELGGPDMGILVVNRDEASGTREAFKSIVMAGTPFDRTAAVLPGTGQVRDVVSRTPGAIGYISIGFVESSHSTSKVRSIAIDGVAATEEAVEDGSYPVSRDLYFFTKGEPTGTTLAFIDYVLSPAMTQTIREAGYLPAGSQGGDE